LAYSGDRSIESVGGFWWSLHFRWDPIPEEELKRRKSPTEYIRSATMAGGLLAANRRYFLDIGGYDDKMEIWQVGKLIVVNWLILGVARTWRFRSEYGNAGVCLLRYWLAVICAAVPLLRSNHNKCTTLYIIELFALANAFLMYRLPDFRHHTIKTRVLQVPLSLFRAPELATYSEQVST
jgi:hypothetical protein